MRTNKRKRQMTDAEREYWAMECIAPPTKGKRAWRILKRILWTIAWIGATVTLWGATWTAAQLGSGAAAFIAAGAMVCTVCAGEGIIKEWTA